MANEEILIVGQGLAGTVLALTLLENGIPFQIMNDPETAPCSQVAAGLFNPITGRKMKKTWLASELFPYLRRFYPRQEQILNAKFFHEVPMYRPFASIEDQNDMAILAETPAYTPFIERVHSEPIADSMVQNKFGGVMVKQTGWLDIPVFLEAAKTFFQNKGIYHEGRVEPWHLTKTDNGYVLDHSGIQSSLSFSKVILTTGLHNQSWPLFKHLPFKPVKGEVIKIKVEKAPRLIFNKGVFCIPLNEHTCRVGATYDWHSINSGISEKGKTELIQKAKALVSFEFEVIDHGSGIRPATKDRRPFIGWGEKNFGVFTGLGSKGVSLAPYLANEWIKNDIILENDVNNIHQEVNITRYNSLF